MGLLSEGREAAIQFLYARDIQAQPEDFGFDQFWQIHQAKPQVQALAEKHVSGVLENLDFIDATIEPVLTNYSLSRVSPVDRSILRLALYELQYCSDVPTKVIINEAIEIAKKYGSNQSFSFVNGVLQKLAEIARHWTPL
jgi:N utilization substance protein B